MKRMSLVIEMLGGELCLETGRKNPHSVFFYCLCVTLKPTGGMRKDLMKGYFHIIMQLWVMTGSNSSCFTDQLSSSFASTAPMFLRLVCNNYGDYHLSDKLLSPLIFSYIALAHFSAMTSILLQFRKMIQHACWQALNTLLTFQSICDTPFHQRFTTSLDNTINV